MDQVSFSWWLAVSMTATAFSSRKFTYTLPRGASTNRCLRNSAERKRCDCLAGFGIEHGRRSVTFVERVYVVINRIVCDGVGVFAGLDLLRNYVDDADVIFAVVGGKPESKILSQGKTMDDGDSAFTLSFAVSTTTILLHCDTKSR